MPSPSIEPSEIHWCCTALKDWYDAAGHRGFGVIVEALDDGPRFFLQSRCVEAQDIGRLQVVPAEISVTLVAQLVVVFCPWCGANLKQHYAASAQELHRPELVMPGA